MQVLSNFFQFFFKSSQDTVCSLIQNENFSIFYFNKKYGYGYQLILQDCNVYLFDDLKLFYFGSKWLEKPCNYFECLFLTIFAQFITDGIRRKGPAASLWCFKIAKLGAILDALRRFCFEKGACTLHLCRFQNLYLLC